MGRSRVPRFDEVDFSTWMLVALRTALLQSSTYSRQPDMSIVTSWWGVEPDAGRCAPAPA